MDLPLKFINHRIEEYALKVNYRPEEDAGDVIYNLSLVRHDDLEDAIAMIKSAYEAGLCVSDKVRFMMPGEEIDGFVIPEETAGICTLCSITIDAMLIRRGVPLNPIGGGVVEIEGNTPTRFTTLIRYEHTTIDPLQVLISQEVTSVSGVMLRGGGTILANIRECHMEAERLIGDVLDELAGAGFTGILDVGVPNTPLLGVPPAPEYLGVALVGGTNAIAAFRESGKWAESRALKGLMDIREMSSIEDY
jgi:repressor of nif and glnA expression